MATIAYDEVLNQIERLTPDEQLLLLERLVALLRRQLSVPMSRRSILELQGLGKEIWQGLDIQEYIAKERASWNG